MNIKNCGEFIPIDYDNKCTAEGDTCQVRSKECSDYGVDECSRKRATEYINCLPDLDKKMCIPKRCEDLGSNECDKFKSYEKTKKCLPEGEKCRLKTCEDMTVSECESLILDDNGFKCIVDKNKCKFSSCYDSIGACESFIPNNPYYYCEEEPLNKNCVLVHKKCERNAI